MTIAPSICEPSTAYLYQNLSTKKANILGTVYLGITFSLPVVELLDFIQNGY